MMAMLSGRLGVVLAAIVLIVLVGWSAARQVRITVDAAAATARAECEARWRAEIAAANLAAAQTANRQMAQAARAEEQAQAAINDLKDQLTELERANAALPDASGCGLDRERVRLLNR